MIIPEKLLKRKVEDEWMRTTMHRKLSVFLLRCMYMLFFTAKVRLTENMLLFTDTHTNAIINACYDLKVFSRLLTLSSTQ